MVEHLVCLETVFVICEGEVSLMEEVAWQLSEREWEDIWSGVYCYHTVRASVAIAVHARSYQRQICPCRPRDSRFWVGRGDLLKVAGHLRVELACIGE